MEKAIKKYWPFFLLPTLAAFIIGFVWPFLWGIFLSFHKFTTISKTTFVGLDNYFKVFQDSTFVSAFIISIDFTHICLRKFFISFRHFRNCPVQSTRCFFRIGYNRNHQVRNSVVDT